MLAYTHIGYVISGWVVTVGGIAAYAAWTIRRGKALARAVPPEDRRWS